MYRYLAIYEDGTNAQINEPTSDDIVAIQEGVLQIIRYDGVLCRIIEEWVHGVGWQQVEDKRNEKIPGIGPNVPIIGAGGNVPC